MTIPRATITLAFLRAFQASDHAFWMALREPHRALFWRTKGVVAFDRELSNNRP